MKLEEVDPEPFDFFLKLAPDAKIQEDWLRYIGVLSTVRSGFETGDLLKPTQRWVKILQHKPDNKPFFFTLCSSRKIQDIGKNQNVALTCSRFEKGVWVTMEGKASACLEKDVLGECWMTLPVEEKIAWQSAENISKVCNDDLKEFNSHREKTSRALSGLDSSDIKIPGFLMGVVVEIEKFEFMIEYPDEVYKTDNFVFEKILSEENEEVNKKWSVKRLSP